jgi:hypothetical protein
MWRAVATLGAAAVLASGCGGGASSGAKTSESKASPKEQIRTNWTAFFSPSTSADEKEKLLQNGHAFAAVIKASAASPLAKRTKATVTAVRLEGPNRAKVVYTILLGAKPVLPHQVGEAVRTNGVWQVGTRSFCTLISLQGSAPSACRRGA